MVSNARASAADVVFPSLQSVERGIESEQAYLHLTLPPAMDSLQYPKSWNEAFCTTIFDATKKSDC